MAKITKDRVSGKDPFGYLAESALNADDKILLLNLTLQETIKIAKQAREQLNVIDPKNVAGLKELDSLMKKANDQAKDRLKTEKELEIQMQRSAEANKQTAISIEKATADLDALKRERKSLNNAEKKGIISAKEANKERTRLNLAIKKSQIDLNKLTKEELGLVSVIDREKKKLRDLIKIREGLSIIGKDNTKESRNLDNQIKATSKTIEKAEQTTKKFKRGFSGLRSEVKGLRSGLKKVATAFGVIGGVQLLRRGAGALGGVFTDLEEGAADISKTTELAKEDAIALSLELLKIDTRTPIAELQKLAVAAGRLGIRGKEDIEAFVEAADKAFVSLGDDLGGTADEIATRIGKISSLFGLEEEFGIGIGIEKVGSGINELAANSKAAAPAILDFTNRLAGFADVLDIKDVQALGALFDEAGQSSEVAASTLLKLLPKLASKFEDFAKVAGKTPEEFRAIAESSPIDALKLVAEGAKNNEEGLFALTKTLESYGIESVRATGIVGVLTNNTERLTELQKISGDAIEENTSLTEEFNNKNDTLLSDVAKLRKEFTEWLFGINQTTGGLSKARSAVQFLTRNLRTILRVVRTVAIAWAGWKLGKFATTAIASVRSLGQMIKSLRGVKAATDSAKASQDKLNTSVKASPWGIVIGVLGAVVSALWDYSSAADAAKESQDLLNESIERANTVLGERDKQLDKQIKLIQLQAEEDLKAAELAGASQEDLSKIRNKSIADSQEAVDKEIAGLQKLIEAREVNVSQNEAHLISLEVRRKRENELFNQRALELTDKRAIENDKAQIAVFQEQIDALIIRKREFQLQVEVNKKGSEETIQGLRNILAIEKDIAAARKQLRSDATTRAEAIPIQERIKLLEKEKQAILGKDKDIKTRLRDLKKELSANRLELEKLADENTKASDSRVIALNTEGILLKTQIKHIEDLLKLELAREKAAEEGNKERIKLLTAELEAQRKLIAFDPVDASRDPEGAVFIDEAKIQRDLEIEKRKIRLEFINLELKDKEKALNENFDSESKLFEEVQALRVEALRLGNEIRTEEFTAIQEELLKEEQDLLVDFRDKKLNGKFKTDQELIEAEKELQKKLIDIRIEALRNEQHLLDEKSLRFKEINAEIFALQQEQQDIDNDNLDAEKQRLETRIQTIDLFTQFFVQQSDKRIKKIEEEIDAARRQANVLEGLAASGNITAKESLAEQEQIIRDANLRKEQEEKRKQRILLVSTVLQAYNSELEAGTPQSEAFAKAITSTAVLEAFIAGLPTFFEGTENTGPQGQGVDGRGGFLSVLHPFERVVDAENNAALEGYSNNDLAKIVEAHRANGVVSADAYFMAAKHGGQQASPEIIDGLKNVKKAIEDKPVQNVALGEITQAAMTIKETTIRGNRTTTNSFKVQ